MKFKTCTKCGRQLPATIDYFGRHKNHIDGLTSQCKQCKNENNRLYKKNNKDILNFKNAKYYKDNLKELRLKHRIYQSLSRAKDFSSEGSYTLQEWEECLNFFECRCAYTGKILSDEDINIEHIIALASGGTNYIWNIVPCLDYVNFSKGNLDLEEWYRKQTYFSEERLQKIYS